MNEEKMNLAHKISFACIRMMHDGALLKAMVKPDNVLSELGLKNGDTVFEPGCGPGFFTVGASVVAGEEGCVYAYDVNPYAIRYLNKKLEKKGIRNVTVEERNASATGLLDDSVDFAFITGIPRAVGGFDELMQEVSRLLKPGGIFAFRSHDRGQSGFSTNELERWNLLPVPDKDCNRFQVFKKV